ncbi:MAG TPA: EAL domain-containing protein, partial [Chromatiaceae bacterium]|nr:EAL domain-containing protein [Chromatiaceae bacterium]
VNDTSGHAAGDELLKQLALLLRTTVAEETVLARLGGDEFGLILESCHLDEAKRVAQTLLQVVNDFRFYWKDKIYTIGMSIGILAIEDHGTEASHLMSLADAACYRAKEEGRNRYYVYTDLDDIIRHRRVEADWIQHIENALEEDRFLLYRQPIIPLQPEEDSDQGFMEILLRMRVADREIITPNRFLPAAERYNLMPVIDRWVIRHSLAWLANQPHYRGMLSINLSGTSITDPLFLEFLEKELAHGTQDHSRICFEITETEAITNLSNARHFMDSIKELGCRFALDDFGSGMSSYAYLKDLPVDFLKIDGRFVNNMHSDPVSFAMVKSIHELGQLMGKRTIAEFVSGAEVMAQLQALGVNYGQGFYLGRPSPLELDRQPASDRVAGQ